MTAPSPVSFPISPGKVPTLLLWDHPRVSKRKAGQALADLKQAAERQSGAARGLADEIRRQVDSGDYEKSPRLEQKLTGWADSIEQLSIEITEAVNADDLTEVRLYSELLSTWAKPIATTAVGGLIAGLMVSSIATEQAQVVTTEHTTIIETTLEMDQERESNLQMMWERVQPDWELVELQELRELVAQRKRLTPEQADRLGRLEEVQRDRELVELQELQELQEMVAQRKRLTPEQADRLGRLEMAQRATGRTD